MAAPDSTCAACRVHREAEEAEEGWVGLGTAGSRRVVQARVGGSQVEACSRGRYQAVLFKGLIHVWPHMAGSGGVGAVMRQEGSAEAATRQSGKGWGGVWWGGG